jgi:hypothetical protein
MTSSSPMRNWTHHRHVRGDPLRIVTTLPAPQPRKRLTEPLDQAGGLGDVGQQPRAGVTDHAPPGRVTLTWQVPSLTGDQTFDKPDHPRWEGASLFPVPVPYGLGERAEANGTPGG